MRQACRVRWFRLALVWVGIIGVIWGASLLLAGCSEAYAYADMSHAEEVGQMTPYFNQVVDAIYWAEGGVTTRHPFGVLSVKCEGYDECRQVCFNTVRNNWFRWEMQGAQGDFIKYLAGVYCPVGADNDPRGLNRHWVGNVQKRLDNSVAGS